jgi:hypothetical protein
MELEKLRKVVRWYFFNIMIIVVNILGPDWVKTIELIMN